MTFRILSAIAFSTALLSGSACASDNSARDFNADLHRFIAEVQAQLPQIPGIAVTVVQGSDTLLAEGFGIADTQTNTPMTADTLYYTASSSKSFTALAVAAMAARGELSLDSTLEAYLPGQMPPQVAPGETTFRHLLTHTGGLNNQPLAIRLAATGQHDPDTLWRLLGNTTAAGDAPLGTFSYSNNGYQIMMIAISRKTGKSWQELVGANVLEPLGMTSTTPFPEERARAGAVISGFHQAEVGGAISRLNSSKTDNTMHAAGGLMTTANDMARYLEFFMNDGVIDGQRIMDAALVQSTRQPLVTVNAKFGPYQRDSYGLGWYVGHYGSDVLVHQFGGYPGSRMHVSYMPDRKLGVAVFTNEESGGNLVTDMIANWIYDWHAGRSDLDAFYAGELARAKAGLDEIIASIASDREARASRTSQLTLPLESYAGTYVSDLFGTLVVTVEADTLRLTLGNLTALAEPFKVPNSIRLEFYPQDGAPALFKVSDGVVLGALVMDGEFIRQ